MARPFNNLLYKSGINQDEHITPRGKRFPEISTTMLPKEKALLHLFKRALPGISFTQFRAMQQKTVEEVVRELLHAPFNMSYPVKDYSSINDSTPDYKVKIGEAWIDDTNFDPQVNQKRKESLKKWLMAVLYSHSGSLRSEMILFWMHYFPIGIHRITLATRIYDYYSTIMTRALENFRELLLYQVTSFTLLEYHKKIKPPSVSLFKFHTLQILERCLFGKEYEKLISKDRIRRYTRLVSEWSRINDNLALTAFKRNHDQPGDASRQYNNLYLPAHYMEKPVVRDYLAELDDFHHRLLQHEQVAQMLSGKLFRWFVHPDTENAAARKLINKMAAAALEHDYDIKTMLSILLLHESFYAARYDGSFIKSPAEFMFGIFRELDCIDTDMAASPDLYPAWEWMLTQNIWQEETEEKVPERHDIGLFTTRPRRLTPELARRRKQLVERILSAEAVSEMGMLQYNMADLLKQIPDADNLDSLASFLTGFFSQSHFYEEKNNAVKSFLLTCFNITGENWKQRFTEPPMDEKTTAEIHGIIRRLLQYFMESPEYNFI